MIVVIKTENMRSTSGLLRFASLSLYRVRKTVSRPDIRFICFALTSLSSNYCD